MFASLSFLETKLETIQYSLRDDQRSIAIVCKVAVDVQGLKKSNVKKQYISLDLAVSDGGLERSNVVG